jgi:hypothetical protein
MVLSVRHIYISARRDSDIFRTRQGRIPRRATVAAETLLSGADRVPNDTGGDLESQNPVALAGYEPLASYISNTRAGIPNDHSPRRPASTRLAGLEGAQENK